MGLLLWLGIACSAWASGPSQRYGLACAVEARGVDWLRPALTRCVSRPDHDGTVPIRWTLHPEEPPPGPGSASIVVAVHERACTGGRNPIPHLEDPEVKYLKRAVVITLWIHPPEGFNTCPSNPIGRLKVKLPGPLGERELYDGATDPARKVQAGEDPRRLRAGSRSSDR